ncbi:FHA domain-containing protein [Zoogloea sp.]|uniref:FHA domain-containing protein n=1 Tax=Zoogloea sp. TaxID=49181 RepID=UPI00262A829A|nr:FHA domain-containing protein [Zoogloea sp.]MDD3353046.1 FHA domain-containing protein [Zoogloea sp.]
MTESFRHHERPPTPSLLHAEVSGGIALAVRLGEAEAGYAVERCLNRMSRCAEAYAAGLLDVDKDVLVARFPDADAALLAAREMRERVRALPPMSGIKLVLRAGVVLEAETKKGLQSPEALAAWLVSSQNPDSITVSEALSKVLSPSMQRLLARLGSEGLPFPVLELGEAPPPTPVELRHEALQVQKRLHVSFRGQAWTVDAAHPTLLVGRETGNDIVIADQRVSRQHARFELRGGVFRLTDSSTNGTFLLEEGNSEQCIRREDCVLGEKGHIGCGFSPADNISEAVAFALD